MKDLRRTPPKHALNPTRPEKDAGVLTGRGNQRHLESPGSSGHEDQKDRHGERGIEGQRRAKGKPSRTRPGSMDGCRKKKKQPLLSKGRIRKLGPGKPKDAMDQCPGFCSGGGASSRAGLLRPTRRARHVPQKIAADGPCLAGNEGMNWKGVPSKETTRMVYRDHSISHSLLITSKF